VNPEQITELNKVAAEIRKVNKELEGLQSLKRAKKEKYKKCLAQIAAMIKE